jgi:hypothetical protein
LNKSGSLVFICLCLFLLLFPVSSWADDTPVSSGPDPRTDLVRTLRANGFDVEEPLPAEYGRAGGSLLVRLAASRAQTPRTEKTPSPEIFILGVPLPPEGDKGEPFGVETALSFLKIMRENPMDREAAAAFLVHGEGYQELEDLAFSLDYPENTALLYLDIAAPPEELVIYHGVRGGVSPLALTRPLSETFEKRGVPYRFGVRSHELYNLGVVEGPAVLEYARSLEIPALMLTVGDAAGVSGGASAAISAETLAGVLADYAGAVRWETGGLDTHYSLFAYGNSIFFLSEGATLALILFLAGTGVILRLTRSAPRHKGLAPKTDPVPGDMPGKQSTRRQADTCAHGAIILAILGILVGSFMDLSCAPAFIWSLAFTILGSALRFTPAIFICALLSPFKGAETVVQTLREGGVTGSDLFLHPGIYPLLTLLLLPFLFLVLRGIILINEGKKDGLKAQSLQT